MVLLQDHRGAEVHPVARLQRARVNNEPQDVRIDQYGDDNSFYDHQPSDEHHLRQRRRRRRRGRRGHPARVRPRDPGRPGARLRHPRRPARSARASATTGPSSPTSSPSSSAPDATAACLAGLGLDVLLADRRPACAASTPKHYPEDPDGEVHDDGEIWSRPLCDIHSVGHVAADTIIVKASVRLHPARRCPQLATRDGRVRAADLREVGAAHDGAQRIRRPRHPRLALSTARPAHRLRRPLRSSRTARSPAGGGSMKRLVLALFAAGAVWFSIGLAAARADGPEQRHARRRHRRRLGDLG